MNESLKRNAMLPKNEDASQGSKREISFRETKEFIKKFGSQQESRDSKNAVIAQDDVDAVAIGSDIQIDNMLTHRFIDSSLEFDLDIEMIDNISSIFSKKETDINKDITEKARMAASEIYFKNVSEVTQAEIDNTKNELDKLKLERTYKEVFEDTELFSRVSEDYANVPLSAKPENVTLQRTLIKILAGFNAIERLAVKIKGEDFAALNNTYEFVLYMRELIDSIGVFPTKLRTAMYLVIYTRVVAILSTYNKDVNELYKIFYNNLDSIQIYKKFIHDLTEDLTEYCTEVEGKDTKRMNSIIRAFSHYITAATENNKDCLALQEATDEMK